MEGEADEPSIDFTNLTYFYVRSGTDQISNNIPARFFFVSQSRKDVDDT